MSKTKKRETIIFSVGGSLIVPEDIDVDFLQGFKRLILKHVKDKNFLLIAGGGKTARTYQHAARKLHAITDEDADWLGIHSTRLNAHLLRTVFKEHAHPEILFDFDKKFVMEAPIHVAAGWKPGCSTDYDAVLVAEDVLAKTVINLSNTDYVYTKDPRKYPDAKAIKRISWKDFRKIVGSKWSPGLNAPFDPIASIKAEKLGLKVIILNGKDIANLDKLLSGKPFVGTVIR